jgi:hypothetical protein
MKLAEFLKRTVDLPDTADLWILTTEAAWSPVTHLVVRTEERRYVAGYDPDKDKHQFTSSTEIRLQ